MKVAVWILASLLWCQGIMAQEAFSHETVEFEKCSKDFQQVSLQYRLARYHGGDSSSRLLALYLHGGSSKGDDNEKQMNEKGIDSISNYIAACGMEAVFVVPQCPASASWGGSMNMVLRQLVDYTVRTENIDPARIYIFGGSMGGTGTWGMVNAYPTLFAAAMPCAANPSKCEPDNVASTPAYTVMGSADNIMKVETARTFVAELRKRGGEVRIDVEDGWNHERTCIESYTADRLEWVFSHIRSGSDGIALPQNEYRNDAVYSVDGRKMNGRPASGIYIIGGRKMVKSEK